MKNGIISANIWSSYFDNFGQEWQKIPIVPGLNILFYSLYSKDKSRKQEEPEESWSKRNLFAIFVLIPLIVGLLALSIWCMTYGVNLLDIVPKVSFILHAISSYRKWCKISMCCVS